jgi:Zn ribbon nucleic-acid-binding protein|tara:strand:- start:398 stop:685 length:288 start_codon:yes stop_codon:yes gene_type:complete
LKTTKRFISGAVCPECRELDRTVLESVPSESSSNPSEGGSDQVQRRCVSCGFTEIMESEAPPNGVVLPRARFERNRVPDAAPQVVRLMDPNAPKG